MADTRTSQRSGCVGRLAMVLGSVLILLGLWVIPPLLWLRGEQAEIDRMHAVVHPIRGVASVDDIDFGERSIGVSLDLTGTNADDAMLAKLAAMPAFRHVGIIGLERTRITDRGLKSLEGNRRLAALSLSRTRISDVGMHSLATLPHLGSLSLDGTDVSDAGLKVLIDNRDHLQIFSIDLKDTKVTADGVKSLQAAFEKNQIYINYPAPVHPSISR